MRISRRIFSILFPLIVSSTLLAPRPGHAQGSATTIPGCYRVEAGTWNGTLTPDFHPEPADLPLEIWLDTATYVEPFDASLSQGRFIVRARTTTIEQLHAFGAWGYRPDGSVSIAPPLFAPSGFTMSVAPIGENLLGSVIAFTDAVSAGIQTEVDAPVLLRRVVCSDAGMSSGSKPA